MLQVAEYADFFEKKCRNIDTIVLKQRKKFHFVASFFVLLLIRCIFVTNSINLYNY